MFKVKIQIIIEPNTEVPNGVYIDQTAMFWDRQWPTVVDEARNFLKQLRELEKQ